MVQGERPALRFRLDNLGPQPGSRKKGKRNGRSISAGQGASCGFGMKGQKSRSGPGVQKGFEGGQMPLYRRIPKLRGIAGGPGNSRVSGRRGSIFGDFKGKGFDKSIMKGKEASFEDSRRWRAEREVEYQSPFNISSGEIEATAGCSLALLPGRKKWVKLSVAKNLTRAEECFAKKRAASAEPAPAPS